MRSVKGSRTSTSSVTDASKTARLRGGANDTLKKQTRSNSGPNKSNSSKKPAKEKNKEVVDIQPVVYSFRVPSNPSPGSVMNALLPPYWLYHDHAFGVIWMLFHQDKKYIGIAQLHWCLRFLLDLKNTEGEYTGDVNVCIQAVQDDLIEQYANLGTALESQESPEAQSKDPSAENNGNDKKSESKKTEKETAAKSAEAKDPESNKSNEGEDENSSPPLNNRQSKISGISRCSTLSENEYVTALSLTYNEMISRGPTPYQEQTPIEQIYKAGINVTEGPASTPDIAEMLETNTATRENPLANMGTKELISFLDSSRTEHVERIKKEVERLHDLEKFMESIDNQGFKAYVSDDMAGRINQLDGQGVIREVDTMLKW